MPQLEMQKVNDLLVRAYNHGLLLSLSEDEKLSIRFSKDKVIDQLLLEEIKTHKSHLVEYFRKHTDKFGVSNIIAISARPIRHDGRYYYRVTPVQHYWVNDSADKEFKNTDEIHGSSLNTWMVDGEFNSEVFKKAVSYLIKRHESLRSTFHNINGEYLMRIEPEDSPLYALDIRDLCSYPICDTEIEVLSKFAHHFFDFAKGPLILFRLLLVSDRKAIVSIKVHHVITDAWSHEILLRDLLVAYRALMTNREPDLPPLKYQLKEYLGFLIDEAAKHFDVHKKYWSTLYSSLPETLIVPDAKPASNKLTDRLCKQQTFQVPDDLMDQLAIQSKQIEASMFVVIQATFNAFLQHRTGQNDIVIGTYVFGREYGGSEDQIGCYAKTVLIRTVLCWGDSFADVMNKVLKSNLDMQSYNAYTLIDLFESKLPDKNDLCGSFWKFNLQYVDQRHNYIGESNSESQLSKENDIRFDQRHHNENSHTPIDMSLYFSRNDRDTQLTIHYDSSQYDPETIAKFTESYFSYTRMLIIK